MTRHRRAALLIAACLALAAVLWILEHRLRRAAEQERDLALIEVARMRREASRLARSADSSRATRTPDDETALCPTATSDEVPGSPAEGCSTESATPRGQAPDPPPANERPSAPPAPAAFSFDIDESDPEGSFRRMLATWVEGSGALTGKAYHAAYFGLRDAVKKLTQRAEADLGGVFAEVILDDSFDGDVRRVLLDALAGSEPERIRTVVRELQVRPSSDDRVLASEYAQCLSSGEAVEAWRRLMNDPDPAVRYGAARNPIGDPVDSSLFLERAASTETDPTQRGACLALALQTNPDPERLHRVFAALEQERQPQFRRAILEGIDGILTIRDTDALDQVERLARDSSEDPEVRDAAFYLLSSRDLLRADRREKLEACYAEWQERNRAGD